MRYLKVGITENDADRAFPGFTLISPMMGKKSYLLGMAGEVFHEWSLPDRPGGYARMLENGNLLAATRTDDGPPLRSAKGGRLVELDWDGNIVWEYTDHYQHHDFARLNNGNTVYLGWEVLPDAAQKKVHGGIPDTETADGIYGDYLREVTPDGDIAWEWHAHENMDIEKIPLTPLTGRGEYAHPNACFPLTNGDIMVSWRHINLIAIIDRESKQFSWEMHDPAWGHQHDCRMLDNGNITLFANGTQIAGHPTSKIYEIDPATKETVWEYVGSPPYTFFSPFISGAQRLANGNTLICEGQWGRVFEVTTGGDVVWEYVCPFFGNNAQGQSVNQLFRAMRYGVDSPEIAGRVKL